MTFLRQMYTSPVARVLTQAALSRPLILEKGTVTKSSLVPELQQFWIEPNRQIAVPMISASGIFQFKDDSEKNQLILKIDLGENNLLLLLMPTKGNTLKKIESSLTDRDWQSLNWITSLSNRSIHLSIPKLEIECSYDAKDLLAYMKMPSLLGKAAHFGKLSNEDIKMGKGHIILQAAAAFSPTITGNERPEEEE
ncbi:PREDICTED: angiotensinogen [Nanorana parkeri]|uniref:angiotensinogen n=1 Tax=Nanorana parkeri TaxID=125878 RepID=UPI0008549A6D|nr:PREDICTED: angiotensinogen [Nanorana parkeri]